MIKDFFALNEEAVLRKDDQYFEGISYVILPKKYPTPLYNTLEDWQFRVLEELRLRGASSPLQLAGYSSRQHLSDRLKDVESLLVRLSRHGFVVKVRGPCNSPGNGRQRQEARDVTLKEKMLERVDDRIPLMRTPFTIDFFTTMGCNLRCVHCAPNAGRMEKDQLNDREIMKIADEMDELGVCQVIIQGGECFVRPDMMEILEHMSHRRFRIDILTNGTLLDDNDVSRLAEWRCRLGISIDGIGETHDNFRGVKGAYDKVLATIEYCRRHRVNFTLSVVLHKKNIDEIEDIVRIASDNCASILGFASIAFLGRARYLPQEYVIPLREYPQIEKKILTLRRKYREKIRIKLPRFMPLSRNIIDGRFVKSQPLYEEYDKGLKRYVLCKAAVYGLCIGSNGFVYPCSAFVGTSYIVGDLRKEGILDIWGKAREWRFFRGGTTISDLYTCRKCKFADSCAEKMCRGKAFQLFGDLYGPGGQECIFFAHKLGIRGELPNIDSKLKCLVGRVTEDG